MLAIHTALLELFLTPGSGSVSAPDIVPPASLASSYDPSHSKLKSSLFFVIAKWFKLFKRSFKGGRVCPETAEGRNQPLWSESQRLKMRLLGLRCKMGLWLQVVVPAGADVVRGEDYKKLRTELAWRMKVISRRKGVDPKSKSYQKCQRLGTLWPYVTCEMRASQSRGQWLWGLSTVGWEVPGVGKGWHRPLLFLCSGTCQRTIGS